MEEGVIRGRRGPGPNPVSALQEAHEVFLAGSYQSGFKPTAHHSKHVLLFCLLSPHLSSELCRVVTSSALFAQTQ